MVTWADRAACRGMDVNGFFVDGRTRVLRSQHESARDVGRRCRVWEACLRAGMDEEPMFGMRGGYTVRERYDLRRGKAACVQTRRVWR